MMNRCAILFILLTGCAFGSDYSEIKGNCVPRALYQASARKLQKGQEVRFAVSHIKQGIDHIQVQYWENGEWKYSTQYGDLITNGQRHFAAEPYKYLSWRQLQDEIEGKFK